MTRVPKAAVPVVLGAVGAGAAAVRRLTGGTPSPAAGDRWHAVTVDLPPEQVGDEPLTGLADGVEVRVTAAPGGKGTEVHARLVAGADADREQVRALRRALRESKQRLETGEVLAADEPGTSRPSPLNAPLRLLTGHGRGEGRL